MHFFMSRDAIDREGIQRIGESDFGPNFGGRSIF